MKTVFLIRHAKSDWSDASLRDIDRPLNKRGIKDAPFMAKLLKSKGVAPDRLISSPAVRAVSTAVFFAEAFGVDKDDILIEEGIYEAGSSDIIRIIRRLPDEWDTILLFGHNPTFTTVANLFYQNLISNLPTCGIVRIDAEIDSWKDFDEQGARLNEIYFPKQYR
jgi:phosphohistidine phosphatase